MSKPLTYRGARYTIAKGPSLTSGRMCWMGIIASANGVKIVSEATTKGEALRGVKRAIYPPVDHIGKIRKLRRMTEERGCTPAEAEVARRKLRDLGAAP